MPQPQQRQQDDFGYPAPKKPKLSGNNDVNISESSQNNVDVWGDDLADDELDECFQLATQACSQMARPSSHQSSQVVRPSPQQTVVTTIQVSQKLTPSDLFKAPCGNIVTKEASNVKFRHKQLPSSSTTRSIPVQASVRNGNVSQSVYPSIGSVRHNPVAVRSAPSTSSSTGQNQGHSELLQKLKCENDKLKEQYYTKDGEISILREQLRQSDVKASAQLHIKIQEYEGKVRALEKELEKAKTVVELQKLEAWKAKDKLLMLNSSQVAPSAPPVVSKPSVDKEFGEINEVTPIISCGELLLDAVTPHLFVKSESEIYFCELKTTFSQVDDAVHRKRTFLNTTQFTVEGCWESTLQLSREEVFDTISAQTHINQIFQECYKILCCFLVSLRERAENETEVDVSDCNSFRGKFDALDNPNLLLHKAWYKIERGIEPRRILALILEISLLSKYMADVVNGTQHKRKEAVVGGATDNTSSDSNCVPDQQPHCSKTPDEGHSEEQIANANKNSKPHSPIHQSTPRSEVKEVESNTIEDMVNSYKSQEFGFMKLLKDTSQAVASQLNSFEYSGFLTAVIKLINSIHYKGADIKDVPESHSIMCSIVKTIINIRPLMETTLALAELMATLAFNIDFMNSLCHYSQDMSDMDEMIDSSQLESCPLTVLCWLLERETCSTPTRTRICQAVIQWMTVGVKCRPFGGPKWTQCQKPNQVDKCSCRTRVTETMVLLIYESFKDFELLTLNESAKESVRQVLARGIMLLYAEIDSDPEFGNVMVNVEGYYQLLLMGLSNTEHDIRLNENERRALKELLDMEDTIIPPKFDMTSSLENHMDNIISKMKLEWLDV